MIEQVKGRLGEVTAGFTTAQKVTMGAVFVAVVGGLWFFSSWAATTDMAPLYADLETADAAAVVDELDSMGVPYELADQGRTVMVPRDRVYDLRLDLTTAGLPDGGSPGYSLLDEQGITSTRFQQEVAYQRALEGELAATIRSIDAVDAASVHLVIPQDDLFAGDDVHATASVLVETGSTLAAEQVQAIVNLVAGSVEGLTPEAVTVADQTGLVLAAPGQDAFSRMGTGGAGGATRDEERRLQTELQAMVSAVAGPGNAIVTVGLDMDWDSRSSVSEVNTPSSVADGEGPLAAAEQVTTEEYTTNASNGDGGVLGGQEDGAESTSQSTYSSSDRSVDYMFDTEVTTTESNGGEIQRINVAVLLDEASVTEAQLTEIETLVAGRAGIDAARGDTLAVSRLAFDTTIEEALSEGVVAGGGSGGAGTDGAGGMIGTLVVAALVLLIVVIAAVQLWRSRPVSEDVEALDLATLTSSLTAGIARPTLADLPTPGRAGPQRGGREEADSTTPEEELRSLVEQQPEEVARLLRTWLADRRAVAR